MTALGRLLLVVGFQVRRLGWLALLNGALVMALPALALAERAALLGATAELVETRLVLAVDEPHVRDAIAHVLRGAPLDAWSVELSGPTTERAEDTVLVRVPTGVFEGAGFTVEGDTATALLARTAVERVLRVAWTDHRLGPAPDPRVEVARLEDEPARAPTSRLQRWMVVAGVVLGALAGIAVGSGVASTSAGPATRLLVLAAGRRPALLGLLFGACAADALGRAPALVVFAVALWAFRGVEHAGELAWGVGWLTLLGALAMHTVACLAAVGARTVETAFPTAARWLWQPVFIVVQTCCAAAIAWPALFARVPVVGLLSVASQAGEGAVGPSLALHLATAVVLAELVVLTCSTDEPPFGRLARTLRPARRSVTV